MDGQWLMEAVMRVIPLVLSLTVHEFAHAWSAWKLGDDTAAAQGRLTLDPLAHIDPLGSVLLPALGIPFGWAKPVPVNPARFRRGVNMGTGMMLTALAGPLSNLLLAIAGSVSYGLCLRLAPDTLQANPGLEVFMLYMVMGNIGLAVFNMLPIPPLDGSRVVERFLPYRMRDTWEKVVQLSPFLLLGIIFFGRRLISGPVSYIWGVLQNLSLSIGLS
ncbi:site-2 protease family protein [Hyalangium rubrum]|uniref:Site-2 protease family protein n=1 Tax=Hyalangium rubrum TaxID=3103134 RepID=A0ABU5H342_9BACT|nr:site-2 protease family protein [Hyalangium sp. s54d21]MDY7226495.1 site-2 protease family protein [Hyalangium sp. s54d21]